MKSVADDVTDACAPDRGKPVGMTLLFKVRAGVVVRRFDPEGVRGPVPGAVGGMFPGGGAVMSFMPGDSGRGLPKTRATFGIFTTKYRSSFEECLATPFNGTLAFKPPAVARRSQ